MWRISVTGYEQLNVVFFLMKQLFSVPCSLHMNIILFNASQKRCTNRQFNLGKSWKEKLRSVNLFYSINIIFIDTAKFVDTFHGILLYLYKNWNRACLLNYK